MSEPTKADILLKEAQARNLQLKWMTDDEVRADQGLEPLPGGAGKVMIGLPHLPDDGAAEGEEEQLQDGENAGLYERLSSFLRREKKVE